MLSSLAETGLSGMLCRGAVLSMDHGLKISPTRHPMHYAPGEKFSNPISIINKIAYQSGSQNYDPIEGLTLTKMAENLSGVSEQRARLCEILEHKKEDERVLQSHVYNLYSSERK